jgi:hypothetical protein
MMGLKCPIEKHVGKGMMVQMLQDGILKLNPLLPNELFKWKNTHMG